MNNDLNQIRIFTLVADLQSFSRAADRLNIEKSTASQKIAQLEKRLGTKLFQRTTRSVSLTESGQQYLAYCRPALTMLEEGEAVISERNKTPKGRLRVSTPHNFVEFIMPTVITPFLKQYSEVQLEIVQHNSQPDLIKDHFDLAVVSQTGNIQDSSLIYRRIYQTDWNIIASTEFIEQYGQAETLDELQNQPSIVSINEAGLMDSNSEFSDGQRRIRMQPRFAVNNMSSIKAAVLNGLGFAALPTKTFQQELKKGLVEIIAPDIHVPSSAIYVVYPSRTGQPANVRAFVEALIEWGKRMSA